ncbi:cell division protein [Anaerosporomusa subterranea]|uniref:Cell division protein n=1 Tax=Anaerosporomusa subterranea TaxID=1794912 RepID=A0A154BLM3_ANASB|nr:cell division FtsA domain-containing protein [Anaerosporomusa subterranea]KYZ74740.1 cell division protein [Anaerosporomusa subterranea]
MEKQLLFALDIGTRSVVGLIGCPGPNGLDIIATERMEHHTRSMLDGQIHDVPEVAQLITQIKAKLEKSCGPLHETAVAAAGRSLCTLRAQADLDTSHRGALSVQDERTLELAALQCAQRQLAASSELPDPAAYYCVGYSVTGFTLDGTKLISLVGQRGKTAVIELIATFLPRQVIDSMQSALTAAGLELTTLTLEPIAAINVLIPTTMRHLNLALVDVGAGTSDVAITRDGSVIAYGMVPSAGDEITEAISHQYLLDFNVAETVKRQLLKHKRITFTDVLGIVHKVPAAEILERIQTNIAELARDIAAQILTLNGVAPQAVLLVGGGSLTPLLPQAVAQSLELPLARVAIRKPETVDGFNSIPAVLSEPDGVTPLGILKIAASNTLHFISVWVNDNPVRLFNLSELTVADAILGAGIDARSLHGRPGMGLTIRVNSETRFFPGQSGQPGQITINGEPAKLTDSLVDKASITVAKGKSGASPRMCVADVVDVPDSFTVTINTMLTIIQPVITVNGQAATMETQLNDRDEVCCCLPKTADEVINTCEITAKPTIFNYVINGTEREFSVMPNLSVNGKPARPDTLIEANAVILIQDATPPTITEVLGLDSFREETLVVQFNGTPCRLPARRQSLLCDNQPISPDALAPIGGNITYTVSQTPPTVSDVLLAADFDPRSLPLGSQVNVLLNGRTVEYLAPVKNGDQIEVTVK